MWSLVSEYLLIKSDTLEIKNLGKFTATNNDAAIDIENKTLRPAGRKFAFVPVATKTTEDFLDFAAKRLKKSRPEIEHLLEKAINQAQETFKKGEKIDLPHIGYLFAPDKQTPTLVITSNFSLNPDNFGYTEITLPTTEKTTTTTQATTTTKTAKTTQASKTIRTKATKTAKKPKPKKEKKGVVINWTNTFKYAAIITSIAAVIVVLIAFHQPIIDFGKSLFTPKHTKQTVTQTTQPVKHPTTDRGQTKPVKPQAQTAAQAQQPAKTQQQTTQTQAQNQPQATAQTKTQPAQTASKPDTSVLEPIKIKAHIPVGQNYKKYYLIVGSFVKKENAENFRQQLQNEGYSALVLSFGSQRHRVSIGGYNDPHKVIKAYNDYTHRHPGKGIWLLINDKAK